MQFRPTQAAARVTAYAFRPGATLPRDLRIDLCCVLQFLDLSDREHCRNDSCSICRTYYQIEFSAISDGEVGQQGFAVIREAIRKEGMVALGTIVFTSREHVIALQPRDNGMVGVTLRYPYEVRDSAEYFEGIEGEKVPKEMMDLTC